MTQEQLDQISADLLKTIKILKGTPNQNGLLFELGIIKKQIEDYNSQKIKNNIYHFILIGSVCFCLGFIVCLGVYNIQPTYVSQINPKTNETYEIKFEDAEDFQKNLRNIKFIDKSFEYKGSVFTEGDSIGNIKIERIIPNVSIRVWDAKNNRPFVALLQKNEE